MFRKRALERLYDQPLSTTATSINNFSLSYSIVPSRVVQVFHNVYGSPHASSSPFNLQRSFSKASAVKKCDKSFGETGLVGTLKPKRFANLENMSQFLSATKPKCCEQSFTVLIIIVLSEYVTFDSHLFWQNRHLDWTPGALRGIEKTVQAFQKIELPVSKLSNLRCTHYKREYVPTCYMWPKKNRCCCIYAGGLHQILTKNLQIGLQKTFQRIYSTMSEMFKV